VALLEQEFTWQDVNGEYCSEQIYIDTVVDNPAGSPLIAAMKAVSLAAMRKVVNRVFNADPVGSLTTGPYDDAEDKLCIEAIEAGSGARVKNFFPAPVSAAFLSNAETMDPAYCADLIDWINTNGRGPNGGVLTVLKGYRARVKRYKDNPA